MTKTSEVPEKGSQRQSIPLWFVLLSLAVLFWAVYYVIRYWGGLGPGIGY